LTALFIIRSFFVRLFLFAGTPSNESSLHLISGTREQFTVTKLLRLVMAGAGAGLPYRGMKCAGVEFGKQLALPEREFGGVTAAIH
jgi:hypothetical protein